MRSGHQSTTLKPARLGMRGFLKPLIWVVRCCLEKGGFLHGYEMQRSGGWSVRSKLPVALFRGPTPLGLGGPCTLGPPHAACRPHQLIPMYLITCRRQILEWARP